ncbi:MAG: flagellum-specific ATP synthase FliI, partial [Paracoccaceae bacterium]
MIGVFDALRAEIVSVARSYALGRVAEVGRGTLRVTGLERRATLGDRVVVAEAQGALALGGEVLTLSPDGLTILTDDAPEGLPMGAEVKLYGQSQIAPDDSWIGRIVDPFGQPIDGRPLFRGPVSRPLRSPAPPAAQRRRLGARLDTGVAVFDTLLPLARGQRIGLFAGSGVGKSSLLAKFARGVDADVVVIALIGERGRELREFTERVLGPEGMARSVIVT